MLRTRTWCVLAALLVAGLPLSRQLLAAPDDPGAVFDALIGDVSAAPAEFAADLLIRIARSGSVADPARRRELLDSAFMRAYGTQEPFQRAAPMVPLDSEAGGLARAYATGLDTLTLQLRAVSAMVVVDPARARELFEWIDFYLPATTCATVLVPVADDYYATLATIARRTFDQTEEHAAALRFFELYLWRTHLPSEIPAVLRAVKAMRLPRIEAGYLEATLLALVEHVDQDARGLSSFGLDIVSKMSELADADRVLGVRGEGLMRAQRRLLVSQLSTSRCSDSVTESTIAEMFNTTVRRHAFTPDMVAPLAGSDITPARVLDAAPADRYWRTADAQRLLLGFLTLRDAAGGRRGIAVKRTAAWQGIAQQYLTELESWNGAREPIERLYFDEKSLLLDAYADLVPAGALRARAIVDAAEFLRRSDTGHLPRALWFANLNRLLTRNDAATLPALEQSGHPILSLYARTERLLASASRRR